jgi:hypothetical protein
MLELPHVLVGATIATLIPNPVISLPLALISHFLTDYVPHWNPHLTTEKKKYGHYLPPSVALVIVDSTLALIIGSYLSMRFLPDQNRFLTSLLCCFLAVAPDVVEAPYFFLNWKHPLVSKLLSFQKAHQWNVKLIWGILSQLVVAFACLYFILSA